MADRNDAAWQIADEEDDLVIRQMASSERAVLVRTGRSFCVLALWDGEDGGEVARRHGFAAVGEGSTDSLRPEAERLSSVADVMES